MEVTGMSLVEILGDCLLFGRKNPFSYLGANINLFINNVPMRDEVYTSEGEGTLD